MATSAKMGALEATVTWFVQALLSSYLWNEGGRTKEEKHTVRQETLSNWPHTSQTLLAIWSFALFTRKGTHVSYVVLLKSFICLFLNSEPVGR